MREASFFQRLDGDAVRCELCRHTCRIPAGGRGRCRVRVNQNGTLMSLVYGRVVAEQVDPVEKKPLFHFLPGTRTYSIATVGCNFSCLHCQNHSIAQYAPDEELRVPGVPLEPDMVVQRAITSGCRSIAYTYTEPTIFLEYALDVARLARKAGLKNIFVTNGYATETALDAIAPWLDAANVDLKGFSEEFYRRVAGARLAGVLECIRDYFRRGIWLEITTLVIPRENDDPEQLAGIASFIAHELGRHVPWHVSRFFPQHRMLDHPPTPAASLDSASRIGAAAGLNHVYEGNLVGGNEQTVCPSCGQVLIGREGYGITALNLRAGRCTGCSAALPGVWE